MADSESAQMRNAEYWDTRYQETEPDKQLHEWFRSYEQLEKFFTETIYAWSAPETAPKILHLGSGDSTIPYDLLARGYDDQLCVDFSPSVVERMATRDAAIRWQVMDVRDMRPVVSGSIDVAFDKGTFASMAAWGSTMSPPDVIREDTARYSREVYRVLKPDGVWCCVTSHEPHYINRLLKCEGTDWEHAQPPYSLGGLGFLQYYAYSLKKKAAAIEEATPSTAIPE
ncbi:S-adenosyl-L-methionine-dependent methyltransferase [Xylariales sp. AK1849]|nr:S-adenosyl-L-methionine-dependent methyltransferase [Xylariales sp. AK1849]